MLIHTTWYGTFLYEEDNGEWKERAFRGAERESQKIADDLGMVARGDILDREREISSDAGITHVTVERLKRVFPDAALVPHKDLMVTPPDELDYDMGLLIEAQIRLASERGTDDDSNILSGVGALSDIDNALNLMMERVREWYSKVWPEADSLTESQEVLMDISGLRPPADIVNSRETESPTDKEVPAPPEGCGTLAASALDLMRARSRMEDIISSEMERSAPNLSDVVGPLIGARLIHSAGGLQRLALLPSSTVQVLGAEKAFFRFLKEGGRPPKHGVLFQHPFVHSAPQHQRGSIARAMAAAASRAARLDAFGGEGGSAIRQELEARLTHIRENKKRKGGPKGGRQPPFREGWWADKGKPRHRGKGRKRKKGR